MRRKSGFDKQGVSLEAKSAAIPEKLPLTEQQARMVEASQQALQAVQQQAQVVLNGILAAAGIDKARITGGAVGVDAEGGPHLLIVRER